jgi:nicotinamidase-related amidase
MKINRQEALQRMALATAGALAVPYVSAANPSRNTAPLITPLQEDKGAHWRASALIVVDMQNDFVRKGAPLEVPDARLTIRCNQELLTAFRKHNLPVVYTKFISHPHYYMLWDWSPQCKPPTKCCWKGHSRYYSDIEGNRECTEIIDELRPSPEDVIIEKSSYGAFHQTDLGKILRSFGLNSMVITATVTQIWVEETAREAFHHGFRTTVVEDAVSSFAPDLHTATLKNFEMKFGWISKSENISHNSHDYFFPIQFKQLYDSIAILYSRLCSYSSSFSCRPVRSDR